MSDIASDEFNVSIGEYVINQSISMNPIYTSHLLAIRVTQKNGKNNGRIHYLVAIQGQNRVLNNKSGTS